jgi:hypothetical protein
LRKLFFEARKILPNRTTAKANKTKKSLKESKRMTKKNGENWKHLQDKI